MIVLFFILTITNIDIIKKISLINYDLNQKFLAKGNVKNVSITGIDEDYINKLVLSYTFHTVL